MLAPLLFLLALPPATPPAAEPDSAWPVVRLDGWQWRGRSLAFGPFKAIRIRESERREEVRGNLLLGVRHETWKTEFELPAAPDARGDRTTCHLDQLLSPGVDVRRAMTSRDVFRMHCTMRGMPGWELALAAAAPPNEGDPAAPLQLGALTTGRDEWSLVGLGSRRVLAFLWSQPERIAFRAPDGSVDAEVHLHTADGRTRYRVWINPHLPADLQGHLARAAVALLVAEPIGPADEAFRLP